MKQVEAFLKNKHAVGLLILRLFVGLRLLYGVLDNVFSWEQMLEFAAFLEANQFLFPTLSAVTSVYVQFICAILIILGYRIRLASLVLVVNFIVALVFVHLANHDSIEGMTPAMAMLFISMALAFTGAGKYSLDQKEDQ